MEKSKSKDFIQFKYMQLLEESNETLYKKVSFFSFKNISILILALLFISVSFHSIKSNQNKGFVFEKELVQTAFNKKNILIENHKGVFYKIPLIETKKWLNTNGFFIEVTPNSLKFIETKLNSESQKKLTIWTPKDKDFELILPDNTNIKINKNTKLTFSINNKEPQKADVILDGEAFFKVVKQHHKEFIIQTSSMNVNVIGTEFNLKSAKLNSTSLALLEGKVEIKNNSLKSKFIYPGQQITTFGDNDNYILENANFSEILAWRNQHFYFNDTALSKITDIVAQWYNMKITFTNKKTKQIRFTGRIDKKNGLTHFLEMLAYTEQIRYTINNKIITLSKPNQNLNSTKNKSTR